MAHTKKHSILKNQEGFTLIEIIAVLVILGILSVVAVPKYFDLQTAAAQKAMEAAMAEAIGRVNGYFAKRLLEGDAPDEIEYTADTIGNDLGEDFDLAIVTTNGSDGTPVSLTLTVTATEASGISYTDPLSQTIDVPGIPNEE